jgi:hypothetical protein
MADEVGKEISPGAPVQATQQETPVSSIKKL